MHVYDLRGLQFGSMHLLIGSDDVQKTEGLDWLVNRLVNSKVQLTKN